MFITKKRYNQIMKDSEELRKTNDEVLALSTRVHGENKDLLKELKQVNDTNKECIKQLQVQEAEIKNLNDIISDMTEREDELVKKSELYAKKEAYEEFASRLCKVYSIKRYTKPKARTSIVTLFKNIDKLEETMEADIDIILYEGRYS